MRERKTLFFGFQPDDGPAARLWLEEMREDGWDLDSIQGRHLPRARFSPRQGARRAYWVDVPGRRARTHKDSYLQAWSLQGWEPVGDANGLYAFRSSPGQRPYPVPTPEDPHASRRRLLAGLGWLVFGLLLAGLVFWTVLPTFRLYDVFLNNKTLLTGLMLLLLPVSLLASLVQRLRPHQAGAPADPRRARLRGVVPTAVTLLLLAFSVLSLAADFWGIFAVSRVHQLSAPPLLTWEDLGRTGYEPWGREEGTWLLTRASSQQWQTADDASLRVDRYDATYPWVSDLVYQGLRRDQPLDTPTLAILRYGNTVLHLEGPVEFDSPEVRAILVAKLAEEVSP